MIDIKNNILSLTDFKRNSTDVLKRVKDNKTPAVLTVNGSASVVVIDAECYQKMAQDAEIGSLMRGINAGIAGMKEGKGIPAQQVFDAIRDNIRSQTRRQG